MENVNFLAVFTDEALLAEVTRRGLVPAPVAVTVEQQVAAMVELLGDGKVALSDLWGQVDGAALAEFLELVDDGDLWEAISDKEHYGAQATAITAALETLYNAKREVQSAINELER